MPARSAPKLPLNVVNGTLDSFTDSEIMELIKQNVKMVLLTNPGERIMIPEFGVGVKRYLFEMSNSPVFDELEFAVKTQLRRYIQAIDVLAVCAQPFGDEHKLFLSISYEVDFLKAKDQLDIILEY